MEHSRIAWRGFFEVWILGPEGRKRERFPNLITDAGLDYLAGLLADSADPITHVALGDGNSPPTVSDTALANERFRKAVTQQEPMGVGVMRTTLFVASYEANFGIQEIGIFAGGLSDPDSGTLLARVLWSHAKNELESLQISRVDTLARV